MVFHIYDSALAYFRPRGLFGSTNLYNSKIVRVADVATKDCLMTLHPRLSLNALSTLDWSFDQDLDLWTEVGVHHAGLVGPKLRPDWAAAAARLRGAGIRSSTVMSSPFNLKAPETWDATRADIIEVLEMAVATQGDCAFISPGGATGAPWDDVLKLFAEAIAPCAAHARRLGVRLGFEPTGMSEASFVNTLRDAVDVAEHTGLAIAIDFTNIWKERDWPYVLKRAVSHLCLVQICDIRIASLPAFNTRVHMGEGSLQLGRLLSEVLEAGYRGLFDLEVPGAGRDPAGLRRGIAQASAFLTEAGA
jgi:sugar phosphate isomerase/epimerase